MKQKIMELMGTRIVLLIYHPDAEKLLDQAEGLLEDYEKRFSANDPGSDLMAVNQQAGIQPVPVDIDLFELIETGKKYSLASNKKLNIAVGPLVKLWKIGFKGAHLPSEREIEEKLKLIDPENIQLDSAKKTVYLTKKGMEIDLGAVAKGYFADQLKKYFIQQGVKSGLIDLGGNVLTIGENPKYKDGYWRVGLQKPAEQRGELAGAAVVKDKSVVTSGIYERSFDVMGKKYHHIFDSETGYPIENETASVTVVSDESIEGELLTTILFNMEPEAAVAYAASLSHIDALIMTKDNRAFFTPEMRTYAGLFSRQ